MRYRHRGEVEVKLCPFLTSALDWVGGHRHTRAALPPGKKLNSARPQ